MSDENIIVSPSYRTRFGRMRMTHYHCAICGKELYNITEHRNWQVKFETDGHYPNCPTQSEPEREDAIEGRILWS